LSISFHHYNDNSNDNSTLTRLRFPATASFTVHTDFNGGALSSDFGVLLMQDRAPVSVELAM